MVDHSFQAHLAAYRDELEQLYYTLYPDDSKAFSSFLAILKKQYRLRRRALKAIDLERLRNPEWYRSQKLLGMMLYTNSFGKTLKGVQEKLPYLEECGINYLHLMPLLESPKGKSDGGYAVSDFRKVRSDLGIMKDLSALADACHNKNMVICLDFVLNHTSEEHEWARKARQGEPGYRERYFFYDTREIPDEFEKTIPQVFPTTAPGSFTELADCGQVVMTNFYPFQWDLNYGNPIVLNEMTENLLFLANCGIDVIRLDAVPYIWKKLGTPCRNLPEVHKLVRLLRLAIQVVCPGVLLLGEVVMEPSKVVPYFGSADAPECHMLYNVTTMATTWHTLATGDITLLRRQLDTVFALPQQFLFLNYLRCHDDIGWGLDYPFLSQTFGTEEGAHKKYLNDYFTGKWPGSFSRGELYNDDPRLRDARLCGTTASLCGLQTVTEEIDRKRCISCDLMLHAFMLSQSGLPVLYSGDEIAQLNDDNYHSDPDKKEDSRYLHRGDFQWDVAENRHVPGTMQYEVFHGLRHMEEVRAAEECFSADATAYTMDCGSNHVLALCRNIGQRELICLYNFSNKFVEVYPNKPDAYEDLLFGTQYASLRSVVMYPYGYAWLLKK